MRDFILEWLPTWAMGFGAGCVIGVGLALWAYASVCA